MNALEKLEHELKCAAAIAGTPEGTRLQNLVCAGIPIYNIFAALYGLPVLPLPSFCTPTPAPSPAPPA